MKRFKDRLYTAFVVAVCLGVPVLAGWGFLVLVGKVMTALGWL